MEDTFSTVAVGGSPARERVSVPLTFRVTEGALDLPPAVAKEAAGSEIPVGTVTLNVVVPAAANLKKNDVLKTYLQGPLRTRDASRTLGADQSGNLEQPFTLADVVNAGVGGTIRLRYEVTRNGKTHTSGTTDYAVKPEVLDLPDPQAKEAAGGDIPGGTVTLTLVVPAAARLKKGDVLKTYLQGPLRTRDASRTLSADQGGNLEQPFALAEVVNPGVGGTVTLRYEVTRNGQAHSSATASYTVKPEVLDLPDPQAKEAAGGDIPGGTVTLTFVVPAAARLKKGDVLKTYLQGPLRTRDTSRTLSADQSGNLEQAFTLADVANPTLDSTVTLRYQVIRDGKGHDSPTSSYRALRWRLPDPAVKEAAGGKLPGELEAFTFKIPIAARLKKGDILTLCAEGPEGSARISGPLKDDQRADLEEVMAASELVDRFAGGNLTIWYKVERA